MPCVSPSADDYAQDARREQQAKVNSIYRENDMLREQILLWVDFHGINGLKGINPEVLKLIEDNQVKHRKEDLDRLKKTFTKTKDALKLGLVMLADPKKPLEPQLGFNPDEF